MHRVRPVLSGATRLVRLSETHQRGAHIADRGDEHLVHLLRRSPQLAQRSTFSIAAQARVPQQLAGRCCCTSAAKVRLNHRRSAIVLILAKPTRISMRFQAEGSASKRVANSYLLVRGSRHALRVA